MTSQHLLNQVSKEIKEAKLYSFRSDADARCDRIERAFQGTFCRISDHTDGFRVTVYQESDHKYFGFAK